MSSDSIFVLHMHTTVPLLLLLLPQANTLGGVVLLAILLLVLDVLQAR
jgi:hypothetical protein